MIVECRSCETRFELDESRVPLSGIRVRCSRCKEAFFLPHPDASESDVVDEIAQQAASGAAAPGTTQDLGGTAPAAVGAPAADAAASEDDDEEWEFNTDDGPPASAPAPGAAAAPAADGLAAAEADEAPDDDAGESFDPVHDASGLELDEPNAAGPAAQTPAASDEESATEALARSIAEELEAEPDADVYADGDLPAAPAVDPDEASLAGDLGEPEDWDFLGAEAAAVAAPPAAAVEAAPTSAAAVATPGAGSVAFETPAADAQWHAERSSGALAAAAGRAGAAGGWLLVAALVGLALAQAHGLLRLPQPFAAAAREAAPPVFAFDGFEAREIRADWTWTLGGEALLAVRGRLFNSGPQPLAARSLIEVQWLDASGRPLDAPSVLAGIPLDAQAIRMLTRAERRSAAAQAAARLAVVPVGGHSSVRFAAYAESPPRGAARLRVAARPLPVGAPRPAEPSAGVPGPASSPRDAVEPGTAPPSGGLPPVGAGLRRPASRR